jgi:GH15 family glucan-1,4-alpha-glucosidase
VRPDDAASAKRIDDFALIGDCETAALISRTGTVEWLCWPAFDSEACFTALLGDGSNGCWSIAPKDRLVSASRAYLPDTLVLETRLETSSGRLTLTDFMPPRSESSHLVRIVRCEAGEVEARSELALRFEYGRRPPWITAKDGHIQAIAGPNGVQLASEPAHHTRGGDCLAEFRLKAGESRAFTLSWFPSHEQPPEPPDPQVALRNTVEWWRAWASRSSYRGPWREAVVRSLITLKALTYRPTGGVVAAVTSSVPETPGGSRNWDYRFCWLRDATFTLLSLLQAGYVDEAAAWRDWLLRAVAGQPADLQPLYTVSGRRHIIEWSADWLGGMAGSRPVRFGNAAADQFQLDAYGEVIDALYQAERQGVRMDASGRRLQKALIDHVAETWREPDCGIWEVRGPPQRFTHSQVMAWAALDRGVKAAEQLGVDFPAGRWRKLRDDMHAEICQGCFNRDRKAFTQAFGSPVLDASVLLIPHIGFLPADDPRMVQTVAAIEQDLMWNGFVRRYSTAQTDDGIAEDEGVFLACSFWLADTLVMQGRGEDGQALFERLLAVRNDVGLLSEEYDPASGRLAGNFPQALSHLALVNTAFSLQGWGPAQERSAHGAPAKSPPGPQRVA